MAVIWKFPFHPNVDGSGDLFMPPGARIVHFDAQHDVMCVWAIVDPAAPTERRRFEIVGTGHSVPDGATYVGTCQVSGGDFVFHLFEVDVKAPKAHDRWIEQTAPAPTGDGDDRGGAGGHSGAAPDVPAAPTEPGEGAP